MKKISLLLIINAFGILSFAQTKEQTMETRAREFHRMITLSDKAEWRKFVQDNYTQSFIERQMKAKIKRQENQDVSEKEDQIKGTVEDKMQMLERLHNDFSGSKIAALKSEGDQVMMVIESSGLNGNFKLKFSKEKPYLIDGLSIEVRSDGD